MVQDETVNKYFVGVKPNEVFPLLNIIAKQNGLSLKYAREFRISKRILIKSILEN